MYNQPPPVFPGGPPPPPPHERPSNWNSGPPRPPPGNSYYSGLPYNPLAPKPPGPPPSRPAGPFSMPPMPHPSDPSYPAWYKQWYEIHLPGSPVFSSAPPPPPPPTTDTPGPSPAKKPCLNLTSPPPPPPPTTSTTLLPWQAAKSKAVIYTTPRPPTPDPPAPPPGPPPFAAPVPPFAAPVGPGTAPGTAPESSKGKMQWFYDGESWVYADKQPEIKKTEPKPEFVYSYAKGENPVGQALLNNIRGRYGKRIDENKPKAVPVRCEVCSLTVTCQATYETHMAGKPHKKRVVQMEKLKKEEEKKEAARLAQVELAKLKTEAMLAGKSITELPVVTVQQTIKEEPTNPEDLLEVQPNGDFLCTICGSRMNSKECANSHLTGAKHRKKFAQMKKRGGMRPTPCGRGVSVVKPAPAPISLTNVVKPSLIKQEVQVKTEKTELEEEAQEEYDRAFSEAMAAGTDLETAKKSAEAAKEAVLTGSADLYETADPEKPTWPPRGILILKKPVGFNPGIYRCELCKVNLSNEEIMQFHLSSPGHKVEVAKENSLSVPNRGKVYQGRSGAGNFLKAQRGRRGLISTGEMMPEKLTKAQRREESNDIAASIQNHLAKQTGEVKVLPLLMSFVRGETIQPEPFSVKTQPK